MNQANLNNEIYYNNVNIIINDAYIINNYIDFNYVELNWSIDRNPDYNIINILNQEQTISQEIDIITEEFSVSEEDKNCCICIESREDINICRLNCSHQFCYECILSYRRTNINNVCCPLCRTRITNISVQSHEIREQFN